MSQSTENILYVGHNIQLATTMLEQFSPNSSLSNYKIYHLEQVDDIQTSLTERIYSHLICELPFSRYLANKIAVDFPSLKTNYLRPFDFPKATELATVMDGLLSDEVKATLEHLSVPIYFKNKQGLFIACNSYFLHLFGLTSSQVIGKKEIDGFCSCINKSFIEDSQESESGQKVLVHECQLEDLTGELSDFVFRKEIVANGDIEIGMVFDVTEMNKTKLLLEKERVMLRATIDSSEDIIIFKGLDNLFSGCNKQFEKLVGRCESEIIGKTDKELFELAQGEVNTLQDQSVMANNMPCTASHYLTAHDGSRHFIEMKKVPLLSQAGKVQGMIGIGHDITERYKMKKRLKITETVFENSKENIIVTDNLGTIISTNKTCCLTSGYSEEELIGFSVNIFKSVNHEQIEKGIKENKTWQGKVTYVRKNGEMHYAWCEVKVVEYSQLNVGNRIYSLIDLSCAEGLGERVQFLAKSDPLTGLFNRIALYARLEDAISRAGHKQVAMAVVFVDINNFQAINDKYGYNCGDKFLKAVAKRLVGCVSEKDTVARFGDDQFVFIIDELANEQDAAIVSQKIASQFSDSFIIDEFSEHLSAAIGIAMSPDDGENVDMLIENAEKAMKRGKSEKVTSYNFYTEELTAYSSQQFAFENELKQALQEDQFELHFQPQYDLNKRQTVAMEALLHWNHPSKGKLPLDDFFVVAANSGLLVLIGLQIFRKAAMQAVSWNRTKIKFGRIVINFSIEQLENTSLLADLQSILLETKCSHQWLEFSVDEVVFDALSSTMYSNLLGIRKLGIALTVNNLGENRTVLHLLEQLQIEKFKVSNYYTGSAYSHVLNDGLINAVLGLGRSLGVSIVSDSLSDRSNDPYLKDIDFDLHQKQEKTMKASEATFYLHCKKR